MFDRPLNIEFDDLTEDVTTAYHDEVRPYAENALRHMATSENVIDLKTTIEKMIGICTRHCQTAKARCADPAVRAFIHQYVNHYMDDDTFVARMRVGMLQHLLVQTGTALPDQTRLQQLVRSAIPDRHAEHVLTVSNTADHYAMRVALIRTYVGDAIIRVLSDEMTIPTT